MKAKRFLIVSLLAAGFSKPAASKLTINEASTAKDEGASSPTLMQIFRQSHPITLAGHSSHRSHSSHTSHRSSTGGYDGGDYSYPAPATPSPPPAPPQPDDSQASPLPAFAPKPIKPNASGALPQPSAGRGERFVAIVKRVQIALLAWEYYKGPIDGVVGPGVRAAARKFQREHNLSVTGTITPELLDALRVSSDATSKSSEVGGLQV
jgi:His-Xaa-Ser repeat protein HxsA